MKVQLLYFSGCPHVEGAREVLHRLLGDLAVEEIDTGAPHAPEHLRGWGSPTILVDGVDVAGGEPDGSCCRLYPDGSTRGVPSDDAIRAALARARKEGRTW
jgi:hypothetical protein